MSNHYLEEGSINNGVTASGGDYYDQHTVATSMGNKSNRHHDRLLYVHRNTMEPFDQRHHQSILDHPYSSRDYNNCSMESPEVSEVVAEVSVTSYSVSTSQLSIVPRMSSLAKTKNETLLEDQKKELRSMGFPSGLVDELGRTRAVYPLRFWIVDNSGSMMSNDGVCLREHSTTSSTTSTKRSLPSGTTSTVTSVRCTRWVELQDTVNYHASLAGILQASTCFRLLNDPGVRCGPQEFCIAESGKNVLEEVQFVHTMMRTCKPNGPTPLTSHLVEIGQRIAVMADSMRVHGLEAVVILATDGLPTSPSGETSENVSREFAQALQHLQGLPVWIVVRLCTDDPEVVDFYNSLDKALELPLEVLDDFFDEAKEISRHNRWLNYCLPLHRCRELGYQHRIFDLLDERPLNKDEVAEFCSLLFGPELLERAPDVHEEWNGFVKFVGAIQKDETLQFNPMTKKLEPWIDVGKLKMAFGGGTMSLFRRNK
jgi:hypothetical protein